MRRISLPPCFLLRLSARLGPTQLIIDGKFVNSISGKTFDTINPATGEVIAKIQEADKADVDLAVKAARRAFQTWRNVNPAERCRLINRLADLIEQHKEELAQIESAGAFRSPLFAHVPSSPFECTNYPLADNGKPISHARIDLHLVLETLRYFAGWADKLTGKTIPVNGDVRDRRRSAHASPAIHSLSLP